MTEPPVANNVTRRVVPYCFDLVANDLPKRMLEFAEYIRKEYQDGWKIVKVIHPKNPLKFKDSNGNPQVLENHHCNKGVIVYERI